MKFENITNKQFYRRQVYPKLGFLNNKDSMFYYVLLLIFCGLLFFGYALITQYFTTPYTGDFAMQGIPFGFNFYDTWWTFFDTGKFPYFDLNTFLGADTISSNTFYGLFSPFTFPILLFPRSFVPQAMALMSIARLVVGALFFRIYVKYLGASEKSARIFSIAYAFSGWIAYFLWFNSFYEVLTFFPLVFYGIEKVLKEKNILPLVLGLFFLGISNYFYFITVGIFGVLYAGFRYFQTIKSRNYKDNLNVILLGFIGFACGFGLSAFLTYPAIVYSFTIPRSTGSTYWQTLVYQFHNDDFDSMFSTIFYNWYYDGYKGYFPFAELFYPTLSGRFVSIMRVNWYECVGSGLYMFAPATILLFASMYQSFKEKKVSHFIAIGFMTLCLFIPFLYYLIGAFSSAYGRWQIVIPLFALAYVSLVFDKREFISKKTIFVSGVAVLFMTIVTYFLAQYQISIYTTALAPIGDAIWVVVYQTIVVIISVSLLTFWWNDKKLFSTMQIITMIELTVMGTIVANVHGLSSFSNSLNGGYENFTTETRIISDLQKDDSSYYRIQSTRTTAGQVNLPMSEGYNGLTTFHTFFNTDTYDFVRMSALMDQHGWAGGAYNRRWYLETFLGVKYMLTKDSETTYYINGQPYVFEPNVPLGYVRIDDELVNDGYRLYKNNLYLDFATSYDTLYYKNNCEGTNQNSFFDYSFTQVIRNEEAYFKGVILDNNDLDNVVDEFKDTFNVYSTPPMIDATRETVQYQSYLGEQYFDPFSPYRYINDSYKVSPKSTLTQEEQGKYTIVLSPSYDSYFSMEDAGSFFQLKYPLRTSSNNYSATVFLIGADDKVITYDNLNWTENSVPSLFYRGLYSDELVKNIMIVVNGDKVYTNSPALYYNPFKSCIDTFNNAVLNGVSDVKNDVDYFSFKSNYTSNRFIVTQVAYSSGWKIKATDSNGEIYYPTTYNSQGGFVGFVAPKGEISYEMTYMPPNYKVGSIISIMSFAFAVGAIGITLYLNKKTKVEQE